MNRVVIQAEEKPGDRRLVYDLETRSSRIISSLIHVFLWSVSVVSA